MPKKKEERYRITLKAEGTTLELIQEVEHFLDALYHGDHSRKPAWTVRSTRGAFATVLLNDKTNVRGADAT